MNPSDLPEEGRRPDRQRSSAAPSESDGWGNKVAGVCPACGRDGFLFVAVGGYITCSIAECPNPTAVADLLIGGDEHSVVFTETAWTIEHSLRCRVGGQMADCPHHHAIQAVGYEPDPDLIGRWRITNIDSMGMPSLERVR